jgi:hypothetical protein
MNDASGSLPGMGGMEFKITENGCGARMRDPRLVRPQRASGRETGIRAVSTFMAVDDSWVPVPRCDIYHFAFKQPADLEGFGRFLVGVLTAQPLVDMMSRREPVIAAWNNRSLGRWLC